MFNLEFQYTEDYKHSSCGQFKKSQKPSKATKEGNLAHLKHMHFNLYQMNNVLTKGGNRYFMMLIDDATTFCYVYS